MELSKEVLQKIEEQKENRNRLGNLIVNAQTDDCWTLDKNSFKTKGLAKFGDEFKEAFPELFLEE